MKLIVGLGNPGREYQHTRHNMGYDVIDAFSDMIGCDIDRHDFKASYGVLKDSPYGEPIVLLKPETFMNLSGTAVRVFADYFKIPVEDIVIVYDDMAIPVGKIRLRPGGSSGSHNGISNVIHHFGTDQIKRIRVGIGEPLFSGVDYVLGKPTEEEKPLLQDAIDEACRALRDYLKYGWAYAMNHYN